MSEFFTDVSPVRYEGPDTETDLAYRFYDPDRVVLGKRMEDQLRIAVAYWHSFAWAGSDVFSCTTYTVSNTGASSAALTAAVTGDFAVGSTSTCVTSPNLAPAGTCTVIVMHTPTGVGADAGVLTVSAPGVASVTGNISSNGISALERTSGNPAYGTTTVVGGGINRQFLFSNQANPATGLVTYTVTGANAADFDVTYDSCSGTSRPATASTCRIDVRFLPSATGARAGTLTLTDGTANKTAVVALTGTGS